MPDDADERKTYRTNYVERDSPPTGAPDPVDMQITFDWVPKGRMHVDVEGKVLTLPAGLPVGGIYRVRSSIRGVHEMDADATYVGRSVDDVDGRLKVHLRDEDKDFARNLAEVEGWVEVDIAENIRINGLLVDDETLADERVLEAVESIGVVDGLSFINLHNKK